MCIYIPSIYIPYIYIYTLYIYTISNLQTISKHRNYPQKFIADPQVSLDSMVHGRKVAEDAASAVPSLPTAPLSPSAAAASCGAIRQGLDHPWNGDKNSRGMSV